MTISKTMTALTVGVGLYCALTIAQSCRLTSATWPIRKEFKNTAEQTGSVTYYSRNDFGVVEMDYDGRLDHLLGIRDRFLDDNHAFNPGGWWANDGGSTSFAPILSPDPTALFRPINTQAIHELNNPLGEGFKPVEHYECGPIGWVLGILEPTLDNGRRVWRYHSTDGQTKQEIADKFNACSGLQILPSDVVSKADHAFLTDEQVGQGGTLDILIRPEQLYRTQENTPAENTPDALVDFRKSNHTNSKGLAIFAYTPRSGDTRASIAAKFNEEDVGDQYGPVHTNNIVDPHGKRVTDAYVAKRARAGQPIVVLAPDRK